jgi:hypothetical protein
MMKPMHQHYFSTDFRLLQWFIVDGALGSVFCVDMGSVARIQKYMLPLCRLLHAECFLCHPTHFDPEDAGSMYLRNVSDTGHFHRGNRRPRKKGNTAVVVRSNENIINAVIFLPREIPGKLTNEKHKNFLKPDVKNPHI